MNIYTIVYSIDMNTEIQREEYTEVAKEIFRQLKASKVNGMPFLAYTGAKAKIFSSSALYLKMPQNPLRVKNVLIQYEYGSDTYTVIINGLTRLEDVYADALSETIVRQMGVQ